MKAEVDNLNINKLVNVPTGLNNVFKKLGDLDVDKWKTIPEDSKKLSDVVNKEVVKNTVYIKLNTKVNNLVNKAPDASILIQSSQCNADQQNLEKKLITVRTRYLTLVV